MDNESPSALDTLQYTALASPEGAPADPRRSLDVPPVEQLSFAVCVCFTVNYIMGSGFLAVPSAVESTGWLLGVLLIVLISLLLWATSMMLVESMCRARAMLMGEPVYSLEGAPKLELVDIAGLFLGRAGRLSFMAGTILYILGGLWGYANVMASAFTSNVALPFLNDGKTCDIYEDSSASCHFAYLVWLGALGCLVVFLSTLDLKEQVAFQVTMTVLRFTLAISMVMSVLVSWDHPENFEPGKNYSSEAPTFKMSGLRTAIPIYLYSQLFSLGVPMLLTPAPKDKLGRVMGTALTGTGTFYAVGGVTMALYFGPKLEASANLMWSHFSCDSPSWLCALTSAVVTLFPGLDCCSIFPLNSIVLGSALMSAVYGEEAPHYEAHRPTRVKYRLVACVPPIILAGLIPNLGTALDVTGVIAVGVAVLFPPVLNEISRRACEERFGGSADTPYTMPWARTLGHQAIALLGVFLIIFIVVSWGMYGLD